MSLPQLPLRRGWRQGPASSSQASTMSWRTALQQAMMISKTNLHDMGAAPVDPDGEIAAAIIESVANADCTGHVVPGARPCALGTFSYLVSSTSYFRLSYPNRLL